jgi:hypothetical protein
MKFTTTPQEGELQEEKESGKKGEMSVVRGS